MRRYTTTRFYLKAILVLMLFGSQFIFPVFGQQTSPVLPYQYSGHKGDSANYKVSKITGQERYFNNAFHYANGSIMPYIITLGTIIHLSIIDVNSSGLGSESLFSQVSLTYSTNNTIHSAIEQHALDTPYVLYEDFANILLFNCIIPAAMNDSFISAYFSFLIDLNPSTSKITKTHTQIIVFHSGLFFNETNTYDRNSGWLTKSEIISQNGQGSDFVIDRMSALDELLNLLNNYSLVIVFGLVLLIPVSFITLKYAQFRKKSFKTHRQRSFGSFVKQSNPLKKSSKRLVSKNIDASLEKIEEILKENEE